jgi:hypothetical protein
MYWHTSNRSVQQPTSQLQITGHQQRSVTGAALTLLLTSAPIYQQKDDKDSASPQL